MDPQTKSARRAARHLDLGLPGAEQSQSYIYYQGYALPVNHTPARRQPEPVPAGRQKRPPYPAAA